MPTSKPSVLSCAMIGWSVMCGGCKSTQEIPGEAPATQYNAGKAPAARGAGGGGGGGGGAKKFVILAVLAGLAAAAWFLKKKFM